MLVERCYRALDLTRLHFRDPDHRCAVASVDAATVEEVVGVCLLAQPELVVAAVVVIGVVVVAAAIAAELEKERSCDEWFTACLETRIASMPGPLYGHSQCWACKLRCVQLGGVWPDEANGKPCR